MSDLIERQKAIDELISESPEMNYGFYYAEKIKALPSAQSEQTEMIKEIRKWINSANRGNADYFIVDKIEEIINRYE